MTIDPEAGQKPADNPQNGDESSRFDCGAEGQPKLMKLRKSFQKYVK